MTPISHTKPQKFYPLITELATWRQLSPEQINQANRPQAISGTDNRSPGRDHIRCKLVYRKSVKQIASLDANFSLQMRAFVMIHIFGMK